MPFTTQYPNQSLVATNSSQNNFAIFTLTDATGMISYRTVIRCLLAADLDGTPQSVLNIDAINNGNGTGLIEIFFPSFSSSLVYDPDFGVLLSGKNSGMLY